MYDLMWKSTLAICRAVLLVDSAFLGIFCNVSSWQLMTLDGHDKRFLRLKEGDEKYSKGMNALVHELQGYTK